MALQRLRVRTGEKIDSGMGIGRPLQWCTMTILMVAEPDARHHHRSTMMRREPIARREHAIGTIIMKGITVCIFRVRRCRFRASFRCKTSLEGRQLQTNVLQFKTCLGVKSLTSSSSTERKACERPPQRANSKLKQYDVIQPCSQPDNLALLLCPQQIHGYCLRDKVWKNLNVNQLKPVRFRKNAWDRLVL